jgi:hypothetical protein
LDLLEQKLAFLINSGGGALAGLDTGGRKQNVNEKKRNYDENADVNNKLY